MTDSVPPSKSQRKRDAERAQALGERLVALSSQQLDRIELPAQLRDAVVTAQGIRARGGRKRQLQYIGKLMRGVDAAPIEAALAGLGAQGLAEKALLHRAERWRTRLLDEGADALAEFAELTGTVDAGFAALVRDAVAERERGAPPRRQRELLRALRERLDGTTAD